MAQQIEIRNLLHFIKLSEHSTFSAAASSLGMAQPSLSYSVSKLERQLGLQLIRRSPKGIELTNAGRALAAEARATLASHDAMIARIKRVYGAAKEVRVALTSTMNNMFTVPLVETLHIECPALGLHVTESMSDHIQQMVHDDNADIGCVYELASSEAFAAYPLFTEELFLVTAPDNWSGEMGDDGRHPKPVSLEQLADLPLVLPGNPHGNGVALVANILERNGVRPKVVTRIDALSSLVEMVERGSAFSILAQAAVMQAVKERRLVLVPIQGRRLLRNAYVIRKRSRPMNAGVLSVIEILFRVSREVIQRFDLSATSYSLRLDPAGLPANSELNVP